jgi:hypothetical protein
LFHAERTVVIHRAMAIAWLAVAGVTSADPGPATSGKSRFWLDREQEYRSDPRGPFTAVASYYLADGEKVVLFAGADSISTEGGAGVPASAVIRFGPEGFLVRPGPRGDAPTANGLGIEDALEAGRSPERALDVRVGRYLLSFAVQDASTGRVLVHDPMRLVHFHGFDVFPEEPAFRVVASVEAAPEDTLQLDTTRGRTKRFVRAARLSMVVSGRRCALAAFRTIGDGASPLFVPFRDATSGEESYGVGRYLTVEVAPGAESTVVDFNEATNPWCAYSPFYNCVLPPEENTLPVAIRAGERAPADPNH